MSDLHPHWRSMQEETSPAATETAPSRGVKIPIGGRAISRSPAAVTGILLVLVLGFAIFDGLSSLDRTGENTLAQNKSGPIEILITSEGAMPQTVVARPGQEIVWTNQDDIPHILESETIVGENGATLYTPAIFPGSQQSFRLAPNHPGGRHTYLSTTSVKIYGEINIVAAEQMPPSGKPEQNSIGNRSGSDDPFGNQSEAKDDFFRKLSGIDPGGSLAGDNVFTREITEKTASVEFVPLEDGRAETIDSMDPLLEKQSPGSLAARAAESANQENLLPFNPYTVGSSVRHPFDAKGNPVQTLHAGAPTKGYKPYKHTETGPALWIAGVGSLAVFLWGTRKYLKRMAG